MKDIYDNSIDSFLSNEADCVKDWDEDMQPLIDKGLVKVQYGENNEPIFSLTELGISVRNAIDFKLN